FINPGPNQAFLKGEKLMIDASPPLGVLYVASLLENMGVEVSVLDQAASGLSINEVVAWVMKENPDILGFSILITSSLVGPTIAEKIKNRNPNITIVFGNFHATFNAERILEKYPYVDFIVRGEGEQTCVDLVDCLEKERNLKDVLGITFKHKDKIVSNPDRPLIKDFDSLPFPDRDLLSNEYHNTAMGINVSPRKFTSFLSSRGCVFKCKFCSCSTFAHNYWR
ncbi:unnamed protein product, partial [marine sediment metagenome]